MLKGISLKAYEVMNLHFIAGGTLGLFCGASFLSLVQVLMFLLKLLIAFFRELFASF
jgi:hypothetical protein